MKTTRSWDMTDRYIKGFHQVSKKEFTPISKIVVTSADQGRRKRYIHKGDDKIKVKDDLGSKLCSMTLQYLDDPKFYPVFSNTDDECNVQLAAKKEFKFGRGERLLNFTVSTNG
jgi:hypothetical protein